MVFPSTQDAETGQVTSGLEHRAAKKADDKRYAATRIVVPADDALRSLVEMLFPDELYGIMDYLNRGLVRP